MDCDAYLLDDESVEVPEAVVLDDELWMLMPMQVLMSMVVDEDELQEVVWAVEHQEVVEVLVVQLGLLMTKKLRSKILLLKMLWAEELLVEQCHW